jgi:hypothetical protein
MSEQIKTYVAISLDKSASMRGITNAAARDYNSTISSIKDNAIQHSQDVIVSLVTCGHGSTDKVAVEYSNSAVTVLQPIAERDYIADGRGTPLYDSVGKMIQLLEQSPDANNPNVSFLVMAITDGEENASCDWNASQLGAKIKQLQNTDKWTFVFRCPKGYGRNLVRNLGIYEGNVQEWEQSVRGLEQATAVTTSSLSTYFQDKAQGKMATRSFYADLKDVKIEDIKAQLVDISGQVTSWLVQTEAEGATIREFVEHKLGSHMLKGAAFYKLVAGKKSADKVQDHKLIMIRDKNTKVVYSGQAARDMLGLPKHGDAKVRPGSLGNWEIFIQSTSVNRKLSPGTEVLYWPNMGRAFKEGKSA